MITEYHAAKVIFLCQYQLVDLIKQSFSEFTQLDIQGMDGTDHYIPNPPEFDWHVPLMSLPRAFNTRPDNVSSAPYLKVCPIDLPSIKKLRVGLVWSGNYWQHSINIAGIHRRRNLHLSQLLPLFTVPDIEWVSLQKDEPASQIAELGLPIDDTYINKSTSFADTAAIIASLDLAICVDTAVCHLVGALGIPAVVLSRYDACWRWLRDREDTPWYTKTVVYTQPIPGDWTTVIAKTVNYLSTFKK